MKFAFLIMGEFNSETDKADMHNGEARLIGVSGIEEAKKVACKLQKDGIDCIELCGAFGEDGAKEIIKATGNRLPIGYVTHLQEQEDVYAKAFPNG